MSIPKIHLVNIYSTKHAGTDLGKVRLSWLDDDGFFHPLCKTLAEQKIVQNIIFFISIIQNNFWKYNLRMIGYYHTHRAQIF